MAIISTAEYKAWAGIADAGFDTRLGIIIPAVQMVLENYCGRAFDEVTYTDEVYDGTGEPSVWLKNTPVTAVSAVKTIASDSTSTTLVSTSYRFRSTGELYRLSGSDDYRWDYRGELGFGRLRGVVWDDSEPGNLLVTYTGGYSTMPLSLQHLMYTLVDAAVDQAGENWMLGATNDGVEARTFLNPLDIDSRFSSLARPWRSHLAV